MSDIYLNISSGSGPRECAWVAQRLAAVFAKEAVSEDLSANIVSGDGGDASYILRVSGNTAQAFVQARLGTIRWTGQSPFRKNHKRKNWFVSVSLAPRLSDVPELKEADIIYQSMKASGPGGQHVNATESAIRATHVPTGVSVTAREERSQHANKKLCRAKLAAYFIDQQTAAKGEVKTEKWKTHKSLIRGNEVRVYRGPKFKLGPVLNPDCPQALER